LLLTPWKVRQFLYFDNRYFANIAVALKRPVWALFAWVPSSWIQVASATVDVKGRCCKVWRPRINFANPWR